ncbi:dethiobiotin synthase [Candidatus Thiosymbion oneisti]|uniref:dethiobiotin synthase n=1 Tax=Candidatus Thiosymbion oneisti TaxID=589554 RepID=UPI000AD717B3|nr:dethiobiotin synthase [Candidatus Thiosymbion oneisti]
MRGVFVTGTDTGCGKTEITLALMESLRQSGAAVLGMKPVASGGESTPEGLRNADARRLQAQGSHQIPYEQVNAYAFEPPIAPHIAADQAGVRIELEVIAAAAGHLAARSDFLVVEGVGGWRVPLGPSLFTSDLPLALDLPVVLVSGFKLGCVNHSLLTVESIRMSGTRLAGWVANQIDPDMPARDENLATLVALIEAPCLGLVPWMASPEPRRVAEHLDLTPLLTG